MLTPILLRHLRERHPNMVNRCRFCKAVWCELFRNTTDNGTRHLVTNMNRFHQLNSLYTVVILLYNASRHNRRLKSSHIYLRLSSLFVRLHRKMKCESETDESEPLHWNELYARPFADYGYDLHDDSDFPLT